MEIIKEISEDELILLFLKSELYSNRFGKQITDQIQKDNQNENIITNPDLSKETQNVYRRRLLEKYRGYGINKHLFDNFPEKITWHRYLITKSELEKVKYINYDYWNKLSSETRLPVIAARNIKNGLEIFNVSNNNFINASKYIKSGGEFPPIILVCKSLEDDIVILEGHLRVTAYFLEPECIPYKLEVVLGVSKDFANWKLY